MDKLLGVFIFLKRKLKEPSTQASLAAVCAMVGYKLDPGMIQDFLNTGTLVFGALGFFFDEAEAKVKV